MIPVAPAPPASPLFTGIKKATREQGDFLLLFFLLFLLFFLFFLFFLLLLSLLSPPLFTGIFFNTRAAGAPKTRTSHRRRVSDRRVGRG